MYGTPQTTVRKSEARKCRAREVHYDEVRCQLVAVKDAFEQQT